MPVCRKRGTALTVECLVNAQLSDVSSWEESVDVAFAYDAANLTSGQVYYDSWTGPLPVMRAMAPGAVARIDVPGGGAVSCFMSFSQFTPTPLETIYVLKNSYTITSSVVFL